MRPVYAEYIVSGDWFNRCRRFFGDRPNCYVRACRKRYFEGRVQVHHRTYERLGEERRTDLVPMCDACHGEAHANAEYYLRHEKGVSKADALRRGTDNVLRAGGSIDLLAEIADAEKSETLVGNKYQ